MKYFKQTKIIYNCVVTIFIFAMILGSFSNGLFAQGTAGAGGPAGNTNAGAGGPGGNTNAGAGGVVTPNTNTVFTLQNPLKVDSIGGLIQTFVEIISYIAILFAVLVFIWIGFQFVMAQGKPEKTKDLKVWLGWTVVGVAVILGARLMIDVIINTIAATGTVSPNVIQSYRNANSGN